MFPGPAAVVYRNEVGEPIGWDYPADPEEYVDYEELEDRYLTDPRRICDECGEHADYHDDADAGHFFRPIEEG